VAGWHWACWGAAGYRGSWALTTSGSHRPGVSPCAPTWSSLQSGGSQVGRCHLSPAWPGSPSWDWGRQAVLGRLRAPRLRLHRLPETGPRVCQHLPPLCRGAGTAAPSSAELRPRGAGNGQGTGARLLVGVGGWFWGGEWRQWRIPGPCSERAALPARVPMLFPSQRLLRSPLLSARAPSSAALPVMLPGCRALLRGAACAVLEGLLPLPTPSAATPCPSPIPPRVPVAALGVRWLREGCQPCLRVPEELGRERMELPGTAASEPARCQPWPRHPVGNRPTLA